MQPPGERLQRSARHLRLGGPATSRPTRCARPQPRACPHTACPCMPRPWHRRRPHSCTACGTRRWWGLWGWLCGSAPACCCWSTWKGGTCTGGEDAWLCRRTGASVSAWNSPGLHLPTLLMPPAPPVLVPLPIPLPLQPPQRAAPAGGGRRRSARVWGEWRCMQGRYIAPACIIACGRKPCRWVQACLPCQPMAPPALLPDWPLAVLLGLLQWSRLGRRVAFDVCRALNYIHSQVRGSAGWSFQTAFLTAVGLSTQDVNQRRPIPYRRTSCTWVSEAHSWDALE